jgi:predicted amidohydrolase YtcJ
MNNSRNFFADQIFYNGKIITVDHKFQIVQAFAIKDDKFLSVGNNSEILGLVGPKTTKYNLEGKAVIPGFIDSHFHLDLVADERMFIPLEGAKSIKEIVKRIEKATKKAKRGEWIRTASVSSFIGLELEDKRKPNRWDLDPVSPNNPVYIEGPHHCYVNSYALKIANIDRDTPQPPGSPVLPGENEMIAKDPKTREPTGEFRESAAKSLVNKFLPPVEHETFVKGFKETIKRLNSRGLTSILNAGFNYAHLKALQKLWSKRELNLRIYSLFFLDWGEEVKSLEEDLEIIRNLASFASAKGFGDNMLKIGGIGEIMYNGIMPREKLKRLSLEAAKNNIRMGVHAHNPMGGKAVDDLLEIWGQVNKECPIDDKRFIILHATFPKKETYKKVKELNLAASCQTTFLYQFPDLIKVGKGRPGYSPRPWLDNNVDIGLGSDSCSGSGGSPWDPFLNIWHAVTRKSRTGFVLKDGQNITREEALKCYTKNNAWITFEENVKGSIEVGKFADFVVIGKDILTCPIDEVKDIKVLMTVVGGRTVFETDDENSRINPT